MRDDLPVSRRINGERLAILGWGRAVLLQFAHPLIAAGVADHSTYRGSPRERLKRFRQTLAAMLALTFGTLEQAIRTARGIDEIHGRVTGYLAETTGCFPAGTPYAARDPALLRWVHATLLDSTLLIYQLLIGPLSREEQDRYCAEAAWIGPLLGVPVEQLPTDRARLAAYMAEMLGSNQIAVGPTARALARDLLTPDACPAGLIDLPLRLPYRLVTAGLLPPAIRAAYGFTWGPAREAAFDVAISICRRIVPLLPDVLRLWPEARRVDRATAGSWRDRPT